MRVWFAGAEVATYRKVLMAEGIEHWAVNLSAYFTQRQALQLRPDFEGKQVLVYSSHDDIDQDRAMRFLDTNDGAIAHVVGLPGCESHDRYVPRWSGHDVLDLALLADSREVVAVSDISLSDEGLRRQVASYAYKSACQLMVASSKVSVISAVPWDHVVVGGWIDAQRNRELQVWSHDRVHRFNRDAWDEALGRLRADVEALGIDPNDLDRDKPAVSVQLAVRSWKRWETHDNRRVAPVVAIRGAELMSRGVSGDHPSLAIEPLDERHEVVPRERRVALPVLAPLVEKDAAGDEHNVVRSSGLMLRECDSCNLQRVCPEFTVGSECGYEIPVRVTTKTELMAVLTTLLEMQAQRVFFARFGEEMLGQGLDPNVSTELERLMRMAQQFKTIDDASEYLRLNLDIKAGAGALSAIFGERVGQANNQLAAPIDTRTLDEVFEVTEST